MTSFSTFPLTLQYQLYTQLKLKEQWLVSAHFLMPDWQATNSWWMKRWNWMFLHTCFSGVFIGTAPSWTTSTSVHQRRSYWLHWGHCCTAFCCPDTSLVSRSGGRPMSVTWPITWWGHSLENNYSVIIFVRPSLCNFFFFLQLYGSCCFLQGKPAVTECCYPTYGACWVF